MKREGERDLPVLPLGVDRGVEWAEEAHAALLAEADDIAGLELLRRPHQRAPARSVEPPGQRRLDARLLAATDAAAGQPRRDHFGVVEDERIAVLQQIRQVGDSAILVFRRLDRKSVV